MLKMNTKEPAVEDFIYFQIYSLCPILYCDVSWLLSPFQVKLTIIGVLLVNCS